MFQNTNVVFLNTFNAILNIMDANACVPSVEFIYSVVICHFPKEILMKAHEGHVIFPFNSLKT